MKFEELVSSLAARGVKVSLQGNYSVRKERMSYSAHVSPSDFGVRGSWPTFGFTVLGQTTDELAGEITARLPLVEPIIAAREKHVAHQRAIREAARAGDELRKACASAPDTLAVLRVDPNMDAATALEQPLA